MILPKNKGIAKARENPCDKNSRCSCAVDILKGRGFVKAESK
jgi:hypothetical protein